MKALEREKIEKFKMMLELTHTPLDLRGGMLDT
jgi:hypothetical protein